MGVARELIGDHHRLRRTVEMRFDVVVPQDAADLGDVQRAVMERDAAGHPKVVADQLGHGIGVNLDVYTKSDLEQQAQAVQKLESAVLAA